MEFIARLYIHVNRLKFRGRKNEYLQKEPEASDRSRRKGECGALNRTGAEQVEGRPRLKKESQARYLSWAWARNL